MEPGMSTSTPSPEDGFDFVRKMWGNMGLRFAGYGDAVAWMFTAIC